MEDIVVGRNPVLEALRAGRPLQKIVMLRTIGRHSVIGEILHLAKDRSITLEYVSVDAFRQYGPDVRHQGVVAYAAVKEYCTLDDLLSISRQKKEPPLYCILDGVEDPQNLGAILRTAEASGIHGIIIRERRAAGLTSTVAKASAGAIEYVPVAQVTNIPQTIVTLKELGIWVIGVDAAGKENYRQADYTVPTAIVVGGEGKGVSELARKRCDYIISIPMIGHISSLNVSVATALIMYEAFYQRQAKSC